MLNFPFLIRDYVALPWLLTLVSAVQALLPAAQAIPLFVIVFTRVSPTLTRNLIMVGLFLTHEIHPLDSILSFLVHPGRRRPRPSNFS